MKELEIPATLFVSSSFIEEEHTIWYEKLAYIIQSQAREILIPEFDIKLKATEQLEQRRKSYWLGVEKFKIIPNDQRLTILNTLEQQYLADYSALSAEIKKLSRPAAGRN